MDTSTISTTSAAPASTEDILRRASAPVTVHLPELDVDVMVARPSVWGLVVAGRIPDHLTGIALQGVSLTDGDATPDTAKRFAELVDAVVKASLMEPVLEDVTVLPWMDRQVIYAVCARIGGGADIARFRQQPARDVAAVADEPGVQVPAE